MEQDVATAGNKLWIGQCEIRDVDKYPSFSRQVILGPFDHMLPMIARFFGNIYLYWKSSSEVLEVCNHVLLSLLVITNLVLSLYAIT